MSTRSRTPKETSMIESLQQELNALHTRGLLREMRTVESFTGPMVRINGHDYINFSSNNYLGLARHPAVIRAAQNAAHQWGAGGTSSRLIAGSLEIHRQLEEDLARFKRTEAALVFASGYQANLGILSALFGSGDCIIMDRLNHASLWDGAKLSGARIFVYPHTDMHGLEKVLKRAQGYRRILIATDTIFSMDGDSAPLNDIVTLAQRYHALTMIDEAHATGIFGSTGAGWAEQCNCTSKIDIIMGTLSKAIGSQGAYICGSRTLIDYVINKSRSFIFTTALAPTSTAAACTAIELISREPGRREKVVSNSAHLRAALIKNGMDICGSQSQIIPLLIGSESATHAATAHLLKHGIFAPAIRPPTVPSGTCRIRLSLTADHTDKHCTALMQALRLYKGESPHV